MKTRIPRQNTESCRFQRSCCSRTAKSLPVRSALLRSRSCTNGSAAQSEAVANKDFQTAGPKPAVSRYGQDDPPASPTSCADGSPLRGQDPGGEGLAI